MAETKKPRPAARASAAAKTENQTESKTATAQSDTATASSALSKAAAEYQRFKAARAAAAAAPKAGTADTPSAPPPSPNVGAAGFPPYPYMASLPPWSLPPSFSMPQPPQGWGGIQPQPSQGWGSMPPQPSLVQPAPQAVGSVGDRLGSTLRLGIDVINMALAGSLRLLGGYADRAPGHGGHCGCGGHHDAGHYAGHYSGHDCCCVFEHDGCCTPSVGNCHD